MTFIKILFLFITLILLSGCSTRVVNLTKSEPQVPLMLNMNGNNHFSAPPQETIVYNHTLIIGFDNGVIAQWDINSSKLLNVFERTSSYPIKSFCLLKNKLFVGSRDMKLYSYSIDTGKELQAKNFSKGSLFSILSLKGQLIIAYGNGEISLIDSNDLRVLDTKKEHQYLIYTLNYDKRNKTLLSGSDDTSIIAWDIFNDKLLKKVTKIDKFSSSVRHILITNSNNKIVTLGNGTFYMYNESLNKRIFTSTLHASAIVSASLFKNILILGDSKGLISFWTISKKSVLLNKTFKMHSSIRDIQFLDGKILIFSKSGKIMTISKT